MPAAMFFFITRSASPGKPFSRASEAYSVTWSDSLSEPTSFEKRITSKVRSCGAPRSSSRDRLSQVSWSGW